MVSVVVTALEGLLELVVNGVLLVVREVVVVVVLREVVVVLVTLATVIDIEVELAGTLVVGRGSGVGLTRAEERVIVKGPEVLLGLKVNTAMEPGEGLGGATTRRGNLWRGTPGLEFGQDTMKGAAEHDVD
jgi:hypothetical protein